MNKILEELQSYLNPDIKNDDIKSDYYIYHNILKNGKKRREETQQLLNGFLNSTMDEARLNYAERYASVVLSKIAAMGGNYFREAVTRRELSSQIEWERQRDHSAHTVYNYLLGWYIVTYNETIKSALKDHITNRLYRTNRAIEREDFIRKFGMLWPYVSLMHDIGYILEGYITQTIPDIQNENIKRGVDILNTFYTDRFWTLNGINSQDKIENLKHMTGISTPNFDSISISNVAHGLCNLGKMETLHHEVAAMCPDDHYIPDDFRGGDTISSDAFDIWINHYNSYSYTNMAKRINLLRDSYYSILWEGAPVSNVRMIDHGVCSGLILLLYATFFYQIFSGIKNINQKKSDNKKLCNYYYKSIKNRSLNYNPYWWWTFLVWATAACAIHNIQQIEHKYWPGTNRKKKPLEIDDDPLAYLGILVDVVHQWDRYNVYQNGIFGKIPLQSCDVEMCVEGDIVSLKYGDSDISKMVKNDLKRSLKNWEKILKIK